MPKIRRLHAELDEIRARAKKKFYERKLPLRARDRAPQDHAQPA
jgi:hypothetical protein